jgi:hypothetical protein
MRFTLFFVFLILFFSTKAQEIKVEKEFAISPDLVPANAIEWLAKTYPKIEKVKWYYEESGTSKSYEAKFKRNRARTSVEFGEDGIIEDIETILRWKSVSSPLKETLEKRFNAFEKFKLRKVQLQWSSPNSKVLQEAVINNDDTKVLVRYEVEYRAEINGKRGYWEGLFDHQGKLLKNRRMVIRATDNFDF